MPGLFLHTVTVLYRQLFKMAIIQAKNFEVFCNFASYGDLNGLIDVFWQKDKELKEGDEFKTITVKKEEKWVLGLR